MVDDSSYENLEGKSSSNSLLEGADIRGNSSSMVLKKYLAS